MSTSEIYKPMQWAARKAEEEIERRVAELHAQEWEMFGEALRYLACELGDLFLVPSFDLWAPIAKAMRDYSYGSEKLEGVCRLTGGPFPCGEPNCRNAALEVYASLATVFYPEARSPFFCEKHMNKALATVTREHFEDPEFGAKLAKAAGAPK